MEFKDIIAVSGKSGLFELIKARPDGLILRNLEEDKKSFLSNRKFAFTPLENIGIFELDGNTLELRAVFKELNNFKDEIPDLDSADAPELRAFFSKVMPEHDQDEVKNSDIRKILSWYTTLDKHNILPTTSSEEEE